MRSDIARSPAASGRQGGKAETGESNPQDAADTRRNEARGSRTHQRAPPPRIHRTSCALGNERAERLPAALKEARPFCPPPGRDRPRPRCGGAFGVAPRLPPAERRCLRCERRGRHCAHVAHGRRLAVTSRQPGAVPSLELVMKLST